uniref:Transcriptional repressor TUP1 n=1 Tax=Ganoderma boninense TaxID=34458 RepID=A0A5K1K1W8_9APHY|nr:Transcriptional repressor TUP1 [Ganoderma boninense]
MGDHIELGTHMPGFVSVLRTLQAIRAIRHPERYGPRSGDNGPEGASGSQSRARGLTRAILDTFPVVKFGRADAGPEAHVPGPAKDIESAGSTDTSVSMAGMAKAVPMGDGGEGVAVELREWNTVASRLGNGEAEGEAHAGGLAASAVAALTLAHAPAESGTGNESLADFGVRDPAGSPSSSSSSLQKAVPRPAKASAAGEQEKQEGEKDVVPDAIGRETCPICIVDFEEGDDLRVLPCEGHHRFHQECVDQWLLELSSSCPLCRQDFQALQTMMAAGEEAEHPEHAEPPHAHTAGSAHARPISSAAARFSKYLRTARRHRQRRAREDASGSSATDDLPPPLPMPTV